MTGEQEGEHQGVPPPALLDHSDVGHSVEAIAERRLWRLVQIAAAIGYRFARERLAGDPLDWMMTPSHFFGGRRPADACCEPASYAAAICLHGLSIDLDAPVSELDAFMSRSDASAGSATNAPNVAQMFRGNERGEGNLKLYTCSMVAASASGHIQLFCAMVAYSPDEVRGRIRARHGHVVPGSSTDDLDVREGFDWSEPIANVMVSSAVADLLARAGEDPHSPPAVGLDFHVEQRFR